MLSRNKRSEINGAADPTNIMCVCVILEKKLKRDDGRCNCGKSIRSNDNIKVMIIKIQALINKFIIYKINVNYYFKHIKCHLLFCKMSNK